MKYQIPVDSTEYSVFRVKLILKQQSTVPTTELSIKYYQQLQSNLKFHAMLVRQLL